MKEFLTSMAIATNEDDELELLMGGTPYEDMPDTQLFLTAVYLRATNEIGFFDKQLEWLDNNPEYTTLLRDNRETEH